MAEKQKRPPTPEEIARKLDSLVRHVASLERVTAELYERIRPFRRDDRQQDRPALSGSGERLLSSPVPPPTVAGFVKTLRDLDERIYDMGHDISAIKSNLRAIAGDAVSIQDMKPYLLPEKHDKPNF